MLQWVKQHGRKGAQPAGGRATLAAFGKHPGWDDHMPDIGVVTETLATLKQGIYVVGIGGQIDSGAWERLEPDKRIEGFDHLFLWVKRNEAVLGQLWSSVDRKGRSKYPMGVCVHLENLPLESITDTPRQLLDQVRAGCKGTTSADHVLLECRAGQDQLDKWLAMVEASRPRTGLDLEQKRRFLQDPAFQPESLGLLRVLHELDNAIGRSHIRSGNRTATTELRSYQIRVPSGAPNAEQALLLWATFLRCALPETIPLLLLTRHGTDWVDVIIGNPTGDNLFCLQAPLKALPLVTAIPYDIAPELASRLQSLTNRFLGSGPNVPATDETQTTVLQTPPPERKEKVPDHPADVPPRRSMALTVGIVGLVLCALAVFWFRPKGGQVQVEPLPAKGADQTAVTQAVKAVAVRPKESPATNFEGQAKSEEIQAADHQKQKILEQKSLVELLAASRQAETEKQWSRATNLCAQASILAANLKDEQSQQAAQHLFDFSKNMAAAESLWQDGKLEEARQRAAAALKEEPTNAVAGDLLKSIGLKQNYEAAIRDGQAGLDRRDYALAITRAAAALEIKPDDGPATELKTTAQRELNFLTALKAAQDALNRGDYPETIRQVDLAQREKKGDPALAGLKTSAEAQIAKNNSAKELQQKYQDGLNAGRAAFDRREYAKAIEQADAVLGLKPKDAEAAKLKLQAQQEQGYLAATAALNQGDYGKALSQCQPFKGTERFDRLAQQIGTEQGQLGALQKALAEGSYSAILTGPLPGKAAFDSLKAAASEENRALQQATQKLAAGDYAFIDTLEQQSYHSKPPFVTVLDSGRKERETLTTLRAARAANDWDAVREKIAKLASNVRNKEPFAGLEQWAGNNPASSVPPPVATPANTPVNTPVSTPASTPATGPAPASTATSPAPATGNTAHLENVLRALEIRFGIKEADSSVRDRDGKPVVRETNLSSAKRTEASAKVRYLKEYRNDGWLSDDHKARLQKLEEAIRTWKE